MGMVRKVLTYMNGVTNTSLLLPLKEPIFFSSNDEIAKGAKIRVKSDMTVSDLPTPAFFRFGVSDPKKLEYAIEREKFFDHFKDKNFILEVMIILRGE